MVENNGSVANAPKHKKDKPVPIYKKYTGSEQNWLDPATKLKPSDLEKPSLDIVADDYPMITELVNLRDHSSQVRSTVDINQPLFQPAPKVVIFEGYAPFATHKKKLYFRNNDSVARKIKLMQPDSQFFEMSAPKLPSGEPLRSSNIAAGMEVYFDVIFKPQEVRDYSHDLLCCTEREKFLVPIRAVGNRPSVTFPNDLDFGTCPVKSAVRKVLIVQNVGSGVAEYTMRSMNKEFEVGGEEISMQPGASQMIEVFFTPPTGDLITGELEVSFKDGPKCYIEVSGSGKNVSVSLSTPSVALDPSYISLTSQSTVRIKNDSEIPIQFSWKSFSTELDEERERRRLLLEIDRMEEIERGQLLQRIQAGFFNSQVMEGSTSIEGQSIETDDADDGLPFAAQAEDASLVRKYRNLRKALELDNMLFVDDIFEVSPAEGQVWANSEMEISVSFCPDTAAHYNCFAYLDLSGRQDRLALNIAGQGIGPHATLSFDVLDVGDVFVNDEQRYEISIINKGNIAANWQFLSSLTRFGSKFKFYPTEGHLMPGHSEKVEIIFESDILGEFSENFRFNLQGNEDMLVCQIKGHVVGPTFHFDCSNIDFGVVSYDYLHESKLRLVNSSKISMIFNLHVPQDGTYLKKEFNIEPSEGTLEPGQHMDILVEFIPSSVKIYDYSLVVDVLGVGDVLLSIPISAECVVEPVQLNQREIDFGDCFIRYPYEKEFSLTNASDIVHTKFEILPQQDFTKSTATFEAEPAIAVIEPSDGVSVTLRLVGEKLGKFKIPVQVQTAGCQEPPQQAVLIFNVIGPKIKVDQPEVRWGSIECLKNSVRTLKITNDSLIMASLKLFLKNARSKFELAARELTLEPFEAFDLDIIANLDDSIVLKEELHLIVEESDNLMVPLSAKGVGTTMFCATDLSTVDMGVQLTNTHFEKRIVLENKGRRPQFLRWVNKTVEEENAIREEEAKKLGKEHAGRLPKHLLPKEPYFTVQLEEILLRPRTATTFVFKGKCDTPGEICETIVLESRVGKERVMKPIIECKVLCEIINPLLDFSLKTIDYEYRWERGVDPKVQDREVTLTNVTAVPLSFLLKTEVPFNLNSFEYTLEPNEEASVTVFFDPIYKDDQQSHTVDKNMLISYRGHAQKDYLPLSGEIIFPNVAFDTSTVNFGCVLNESTKFIKVAIHNTSKVVATYHWSFLDEEKEKNTTRKASKMDNSITDPATVVDIRPIRGVLRPGESDVVEFSMYAMADIKFNSQVLCLVEGGPEYKLGLQGEASSMAYSIDKAVLDYGKVVITESKDQEFEIKNTGKVPLPFFIEAEGEEAASLYDIKTPHGKIAAGASVKIEVAVYPGIATHMVHNISVHVAHFDIVSIKCFTQGIFPVAVVSLPRYRKLGPYNETDGNMNSMWGDFVAQATSNILHPDESKVAPIDLPPPIVASSNALPEYTKPALPLPPAEVMDDLGSLNSYVSVKAPPQTLLEVEMTRMTMVHVLQEKLVETEARLLQEAAEGIDESAETPAVPVEKKKNSLMASEPSFKGLQYKIEQNIPFHSVVAANYICDFGNVILGHTKKKGFKVTNASLVGQMTWTFDGTRLSANGFSIEPFKAQKLVEGDSLDFMVKFNARSSAKLGRKQSIIPLENKGSPALNIIMQATICLPDVLLSTDDIDFGSILIGQGKKVYVRLHNTTPVTSVWSIKCSRPDRTFTITPSEGTLRSGKKAVVCVEFIPTAAANVQADFTMRIDNNKTARTLSVSGEGLGVNCKWDQPTVELGPIIPYTVGDEKVVSLTNTSDFDVEIFSLDFDKTYNEEENILSSLDIYDSHGLYRCPVRDPGAPLCDDILNAFAVLQKAREEAEAAEAAAQAQANGEGEGEGEATTDAPEETGAEGEATEEGTVEEIEEVFEDAPLRTETAPRDDRQHQDIIVVGPPLSGVSTMAHHLSKKLQLNLRKFDEILAEIALTGGDLGSTARRCTGTMSEKEASAVKEQETTLQEAADASKVAAEEEFKKDKKNKGKDIADFPEVLQTEEVLAYEAFMAGGSLSVDTVAALISHRLSWKDSGYGFVFDSIVSEYASEETLLRGFEKAIPKAIVANLVLNGGIEAYTARIGQLYEEQRAELKRLKNAITHGLKEREKLLKKPKGKKGARSSAAATMEATQAPVINNEIVYAVPYGDEPWVIQEPGLLYGTVLELDPQGVKALEENQKLTYYKHALYHQDCLFQKTQEIVRKLERVYDRANSTLYDPEEIRKAEQEAKDKAEADAAAATEAAENVDVEGGAEESKGDADAAEGGEEGQDGEGEKEGEEGVAEDVEQVEEAPILPKLDRVVYYKDYIENVLPLINTAFTPIEETTEPVEGEEGAGEAAAAEETKGETEAPVEGVEGEALEKETAEETEAAPEVIDSGVFEITSELEETKEDIFNNIMALLPAPKVAPEDKDKIPEMELFQVIKRPYSRTERKRIGNFEIIRVDSPAEPVEGEGEGEAAAPAETPVEGEEGETVKVSNAMRWVIKGGETVQMKIKFRAEIEMKYDSVLGFEVMGTAQTFSLYSGGWCEVPKINTDSRNVFMRRVKGFPPALPPPNKRFIINKNYYSFGPLLNYKQKDWKALLESPFEELDETQQTQVTVIKNTNTDTVRITNTGRYACIVDIGLEDAEEHAKDVFLVEPNLLELEEGETKEVAIWAFPTEEGEHRNTLLACVKDNAIPMQYDLSCIGVVPHIELDGPWKEALAQAEAELAANEDKKLQKELEDKVAALKETFTFNFDRQLINKTESKMFEVKNTCSLPVAWEIDLGDFKDSVNVDISPQSGTLPVNGAVNITISFTSPEPLEVNGNFSLRFSDTEKGLQTEDRVQVRNFKVNSEAYNIQYVTLESEGQEELNSIDYGIVRVGDYASQVIKIANKGKYTIGYKLVINKAKSRELIEIDVPEGVIEAGETQAEVKLTFCAKDAELVWKNNKDIKVQISEPLSGEIVETFPVYINVDARYNRFRLQPSKGVTFGAVRFDADAKVKKVELRNESKFDFSYVICGKSSEHDELDILDAPALAAYAYGIPAACREAELGDNYKERMADGGGGKGGKTPAKGKGGDVSASSGTNPLVVDPDELELGAIPEDPLVVGAFTVHPRVGIAAPGETIVIDVTFDPNGHDIARESMRLCISGVDQRHQLSQTIRSFELTGESCFPAILNSDHNNIFEEQEVVEGLAEALPGGAGFVEKLPVGKVVYAQKENLLAYGPVMCGNASNKGVMERIRITNPTKIDTKVRFKVSAPGGGADAGGKDAKGKGKGAPAGGDEVVSAFTVHPELWDIPPHEYRYVNIYFNPTEIKSYRSIFEAEVDYEGSESSASPKAPGQGKLLAFDIAGSGTLPCISVEFPTERDESGALPLNFNRVHINKMAKRKITIRNDGVMPATCLFEVNGDDDFHFPYAGSSMTIEPNQSQDLMISFAPLKVYGEDGARNHTIKVSVLNNTFDQYTFKSSGIAYACDAVIDTGKEDEVIEFDEEGNEVEKEENFDAGSSDVITMKQLNLSEGAVSTSKTITIASRSNHPIKFDMSCSEEEHNAILKFSPQTGHLGPNGSRKIEVFFNPTEPVKLDAAAVKCMLRRIEYKPNPDIPEEDINVEEQEAEQELWGKWDDSMKSTAIATEEILALIEQSTAEMNAYLENKAAEEAKGKKGKDPGPPPPACKYRLSEELGANGEQLVDVVLKEPYCEVMEDAEVQELNVNVNAVADIAKYSCEYEGENIPFKPTFLFQGTSHQFTFTNECNIKLPISWTFDDIKRRTATARVSTAMTARTAGTAPGTTRLGTAAPSSNIPCPFFVEPEITEVEPMQSRTFQLKFQPLDVDDFVYALKGATLACPDLTPPAEGEASAEGDGGEGNTAPLLKGPIRMVLRGQAKRPICHFDIQESHEYLAKREPNLKNEYGLLAPIEATDLKVVALESVGLRTRNTFRFHIINPTAENYEFLWETMGDASAAWRCVQSAGMLFAGKRIEIVFEYLPEEVAVAESFFKFKLPRAGLEQIFLFSGNVKEPQVFFSTARMDFHSVMLGGQGMTETVYLENKEHLPFNFQFDKLSLLQLEGNVPGKPVLDIEPKQGSVVPNGKIPIRFHFHPQEEVAYNFNIVNDVKRKPNKLSINVKGEGYAVHPQLMLELSEEQVRMSPSNERYIPLKPRPAVNYADFGFVKVLDTVSKGITVTNNGKYNFDYLWDIEHIGSMISLGGGKLGGTLHKGEQMSYTMTFAPQSEASLDGCMLSFTVAGKYTFDIFARGVAQSPALRFSFMQYDFGPAFITSPGGQTVIVETTLTIVNMDPSSNISVDCNFQKTRALWCECPPTVLEPAQVLNVPIRFAPRDVKEYAFVIPFVVNGTSKVPITIVGKGIQPRLELVNASQRSLNFGIVNLGNEVRKTIPIVNKSKKALSVQIIEESDFGQGAFEEKCISIFPRSEIIVGPRESVNLQVSFAPTKRIAKFSQDLNIKYAGITRKLVTLSGKGQGVEVNLDTDSLPFGNVVINSAKTKKLSLENSGDIAIAFSWMEASFGKHFKIAPLTGKLQPNSETSFDVTFEPVEIDEDIRQDNMILQIAGLSPLQLTCTGACIEQPDESTQELQFKSIARKQEIQQIKFNNPTDKDWFLTPSISGINWKIPNELKVPSKGSAELPVTYYPLTMAPEPTGDEGEIDKTHHGKLFVALPDGSAQLYKLSGNAGAPECSGIVEVETSAKKPVNTGVKINNWLTETQQLNVTIDLQEKPSPATFIIAANKLEVGASSTKEFPIRFVSYTEGTSKGTITFTNASTGEYAFYEFVAKTTMPEVLEDITMESVVRQSARYNVTLENPLPPDAIIDMDCHSDNSWWTCDSDCIRVKELTPLNGNPEGNFEIEYRPLVPTTQPLEHLLAITSKDLGTYKFKLIVTATPPPLPQSLQFSVALGSVQEESFVFKAFNAGKTDYKCTVKKTDLFSVPASIPVDGISAWDGEDQRCMVSFEPTTIGTVRDTLTISTTDGVEYLCDIEATCTPALPQGPYILEQGKGNVEVPFRNYFPSAEGWAYAVDNAAFKLASTSAQVQAKSQGAAQLQFAPENEPAAGSTVSGKLFVTCTTKPEVPAFVFYLKGVVTGEAAGGGGKKK